MPSVSASRAGLSTPPASWKGAVSCRPTPRCRAGSTWVMRMMKDGT
ncbi:hypothetical protein ACFQX6_40980 [Streptosporangium lutulentum]